MNNECFNLWRSRKCLYPTVFLLALLIRLACFTGLIGSDDLGYSYFAQLLSHGTYTLDVLSHFGPRVGVTVPTGIMYWLFGISEVTTIILPLLASSASVVLLVEIGTRLLSKRAALIAGMLLLTFPTQIRYASTLIPEPIMEFWILVGVLLYLIALKKHQLTIGFIAGLCFGLAYLTKEAGIFVCAALFIYSVLQKEWKLAMVLASGLGAIGGLELISYYFITGDPMYRSHIIAATQEAYLNVSGDGNAPLTWRLFKEYPYEMLLPNIDFGLHSIFALILSAYGAFLLPRRAVLMLFLWAAIPMLYLNFGTVSFSRYFPSFTAPRYISQVYFPLFLISGAVVDRWLSKGIRTTYSVLAVFTLIITVGFLISFSMRAQGYGSAEMASLRAIESKTRLSQKPIVRFEGPRGKRWLFAMLIFSGQPKNILDCAKDCLVVRPDSLGLPYVTHEPLAQPDTSKESALFYPL